MKLKDSRKPLSAGIILLLVSIKIGSEDKSKTTKSQPLHTFSHVLIVSVLQINHISTQDDIEGATLRPVFPSVLATRWSFESFALVGIWASEPTGAASLWRKLQRRTGWALHSFARAVPPGKRKALMLTMHKNIWASIFIDFKTWANDSICLGHSAVVPNASGSPSVSKTCTEQTTQSESAMWRTSQYEVNSHVMMIQTRNLKKLVL